MNIAVSAAGAYMQGTQINKMNKKMEGGASGLTGGLPSPSSMFQSQTNLGISNPLSANMKLAVNPFGTTNLPSAGSMFQGPSLGIIDPNVYQTAAQTNYASLYQW